MTVADSRSRCATAAPAANRRPPRPTFAWASTSLAACTWVRTRRRHLRARTGYARVNSVLSAASMPRLRSTCQQYSATASKSLGYGSAAVDTVPQPDHRAQDLLGPTQASEVAFAGQVGQLRVGQPGHHVLSVLERDDVVAVAVPPPDRHLDLVEPEPPVPGEHHDVGERRRELLAAAVEQ